MTKLEGMTNDGVQSSSFGLRASFVIRLPRRSLGEGGSVGFRHSAHIQLRKEECVNISQLFDAFAEGRANPVTRAGARSQKDRVCGAISGNQARRHFA
jgi:hypothetical protein